MYIVLEHRVFHSAGSVALQRLFTPSGNPTRAVTFDRGRRRLIDNIWRAVLGMNQCAANIYMYRGV